jgi:hypothetical protein
MEIHMKKIRLRFDALSVESFPTAGPRRGARGTVWGAGTALSNCECEPESNTCEEICNPVRLSDVVLTCDDRLSCTCAGQVGC